MNEELDYIYVEYSLYKSLHEIKSHSFKIEKFFPGMGTIECGSIECTSKGFDLSSDIQTASVLNKEVRGKMNCQGKLSSKYKKSKAQSCDWHIEYVITPHFKEDH